MDKFLLKEGGGGRGCMKKGSLKKGETLMRHVSPKNEKTHPIKIKFTTHHIDENFNFSSNTK